MVPAAPGQYPWRMHRTIEWIVAAPLTRCLRTLPAGLVLAALVACAPVAVTEPANQRPFSFPADVFAFDNELTWVYSTDPQTGRVRHAANKQRTDYTLHCFVLARSARQFFQFARFEPGQAKASDAVYRERVRAVIGHDPSETAPLAERISIPGYADLHSFSADHAALLKEELGGAVQSYLQRGNWRMVLPFSRQGQAATAKTLAAEVDVNRPPVVHLSTFPSMTINHAVLLYGEAGTAEGLRFLVYDPNHSAAPTRLYYDRKSGDFRLPANNYFAGGMVKVYEVYRSLVY
jgi:hypothetical protein